MPLRPTIKRRLRNLDTRTQDLFHFLDSVPDEILVKRPAPDQWSALEAINHIYLSEKLSLQYLQFKLTRPETMIHRRPDAWLRSMTLKWVLFSPLKFKAPPQIDMRNDQPVLGLDELKQTWEQLRSDLIVLLDNHEDELKHKLPFKHPRSGRMTLNQMLMFFTNHLSHHERQIHRIVDKLGY